MDRNADKIEAFQAALPHYLSPERISDLRAGFGLSQAAAATIFGGGKNSFSKYERGEITPTEGVVTLLKLALAMPQTVVFLAKEKGVSLDPDAPMLRRYSIAPSDAVRVNILGDAANEPESAAAVSTVEAVESVGVVVSGYGKVKLPKQSSQDVVVLKNAKHAVGAVAKNRYSPGVRSGKRLGQWIAPSAAPLYRH